MSGKNKAAENQQQALSEQQLKQSQELANFAKERTALMDQYQKPAIDYFTGVASGDRSKMLQSMAPQLSTLSASQKGTEESIYDSVPSGAAREFALAGAKRDAGNQTASLMNQSFMSSLSNLLGIGQQQGSFGLQQLGAGMRAGEDASQTNQTLMNAAAQRKASTMGAIGSIGGMAGSALGTKWANR